LLSQLNKFKFLCHTRQHYNMHAPLLVSMSELAFKESQRKPG